MRRPDGQPPHFVSDGSQYLAHNQPATSSDPREENTIVSTRRAARLEGLRDARSDNTALSFRDRAVIPSRPCDTGCFGLQRS